MADNHKMWEELGMNLELHDQLCEVLPQAVGHRRTARKEWIIMIWWLRIFMASVLPN